MFKKITGLVILIFVLNACNQWKVSELKKNSLFSIQNGEGAGKVLLTFNKNDTLNLSFTLSINNDKVICADNNSKNLQVFDKDGYLNLVIGKKPVLGNSSKISNISKTNEILELIQQLLLIKSVTNEESKSLKKLKLDIENNKIIKNDEIFERLTQLNNHDINDIIKNKKPVEEKEIEFSYKPFSFGIIGNVTSGINEKIYVQNRLTSENKRNTHQEGPDLDFTPSYILVFDSKGNLEYTLGQNGKPNVPFYYIESMMPDNKNRLFVVSKNYDLWSVYRFVGKKRDKYINFSKNMFIDKGDKEYTGIIENIDVFNSGEKLLLSVNYYDDTRFKYRKIIEYSVNEDSEPVVILEIPEPKNELFRVLNDKYFLLWNVDGEDVKFSIWNFQGNIVNTLKIVLDQEKSYYGDILVDQNGKFYTYLAYKKGIEIQEWN